MTMRWNPQSKLGKWAIAFGLILLATIFLEVIFAIAIGGDAAVVDESPALTVLAGVLSILFTVSGPLSFILGVSASIKNKDRTIWKPLLALYAIVVALFLLGETLFAH